MWETRDDQDVISSFVQPVPVPASAADAAPEICVRFSKAWVPVVCGALQQMVQTKAWDTTDPAILENALSGALDLISAISNAPECVPVRFRLNACVLQFSEDNGVSWSDVEGWSTYAPGCFTGPAGPAGPVGPVGPAGPSFGTAAALALDYIQAADLLSGTVIPAATWTDILPNQSFTITDASHLAELVCVMNWQVYSGNEASLRAVFNSGGTPYYVRLGEQLGEPYGSPPGASVYIPGGSLVTGTNTVKLQAYSYSSAATAYLRPTSYPDFEHLHLQVLEHLPASGVGPAGPAGPTGATGPTGPAGATGPAGSPCDCAPPTPPNVRTEPNPQRACDIAAFLVSDFIKGALQQTIDGINAGHTILNIFTAVVLALPFDVPVDLGVAGLNGLYTALTSGTLADFEAAEADSSLWAGLTCAVFHAIQGVGYVDSTNFAAMESAICGYSYVHPDVISALCSFVSNLGLSGVQTLQSSGALQTGDCSGCGPWCFDFDFTAHPGSPGFITVTDGEWQNGLGWHSVHVGGTSYLTAEIDWARTDITGFCLTATANSNNGSADRYAHFYDGTTFIRGIAWDGGPFVAQQQCTVGGLGESTKALLHIGGDSFGGSYPDVWLTHMHVTGTGACPFGTPNC